MNILYIADPNSVHDIRWINSFAEKENFRCFIIGRKHHLDHYRRSQRLLLNERVRIVGYVEDPSTIRPWETCFGALRIKVAIYKHEIDILHLMYAEPNSLWSAWKWLFRIPVIVTTRGTDVLKTIPAFSYSKNLLSRIVTWKYRQALSNADWITCTSASQVRALRRMGVRTTATVIRTGVDFNLIRSAITKGRGKSIERPFVLMPRNMRRLYNHEFTLGAIRILDQKFKSRYAFVFLDSDTVEKQYYHAIRDTAQHVDADVRFLPSLSQLEWLGLCCRASLVVMNPWSDGSPVTAMEAMACRVPVILPPLEYDEDVFADAFCFEEWTEVSLKNAIEKILDSGAEIIKELTDKNFENVYRNGNTKTEMQKVENIYTGATQGSDNHALHKGTNGIQKKFA